MAKTRIPKSEFVPCPEGQHQGVIYAVEDLGKVETSYGVRDLIAVRIECVNALMEDGRSFVIQKRFSKSSHPKSSLRAFRIAMMGRELTSDELECLDHEAEFVGRRVGFVVVHRKGQEGQVFANVERIWPTRDGNDGLPSADDEDRELPF